MSLTGQTILIADDDPLLSELIGRFLKNRGHVTLIAADGADALRILDRYPDEIGLLVADVVMPTVGGFELAAHAVEKHPDLRVIYISGYFDDSRHVRTGLQEAGRYFLKKPFTQEAFLETAAAAIDAPPPHATDGFAFLLGYPAITARIIRQWRKDEPLLPRDQRYALELPVRLQPAGTDRWAEGRTANVSRSGMRIVVDRLPGVALRIGTPLRLQLELPHPGTRRAVVAATGEVARVEPPSAPDTRTIVGVAVHTYHPDVRR